MYSDFIHSMNKQTKTGKTDEGREIIPICGVGGGGGRVVLGGWGDGLSGGGGPAGFFLGLFFVDLAPGV